MAPTRNPSRTILPKSTKQEVITALLAGTTTVEEVCKRHKVQPYQVFAWVGSYALSKRETLSMAGVTGIDPELAQAIGEHYLRKGLNPKQ